MCLLSPSPYLSPSLSIPLFTPSPPSLSLPPSPSSLPLHQDILRLQSSPSSTSLQLEPVPLSMSESTILCDTSTGVARPVVPKDYRRTFFESLHNLSHPSIWATQHLLTAREASRHALTHGSGLAPASGVRSPKSNVTLSHCSRHLPLDSIVSTLTSLGPCHLLKDSGTYSRVPTDSHGGLKPYQLPLSQQKQLHRLSCRAGLLDLGCLL